MDWINTHSTEITATSTVIMAIFTVLLWYVNSKQSSISEKQNEIWHKTNYPDIFVKKLDSKDNELVQCELNIFNRSDFTFKLTGITSSDTEFRFKNKEDFKKSYAQSLHIQAKDTYVILPGPAITPEDVKLGRPRVEQRDLLDRKKYQISFNNPLELMNLDLDFFIPVLDKHLVVQIVIKNQQGIFDYSLKYKEAS